MMRYDDTVKFALPLLYGSADSDNIIPKMHQYLNNRAGITLPVSYFYGSPNTCWNGGRPLTYKTNVGEHTPDYFKHIHDDCKADIYFTYTNFNAGNHLNDYTGNQSLEYLSNLSNGNDGVIIVDDRLLDYANKNFPNLKTKASVVKSSKEKPLIRTKNYYNSLLDRYDTVVLHPDDNLNYDLISSLNDVSRVEILIDERCTNKCPVRDLHYDINAALNSEDPNVVQQAEEDSYNLFTKLCPREKMIDDVKGKGKLDVLVNNNHELDQLVELGIKRFKTSGRGNAFKESYAIGKFLESAIIDEDLRNGLGYFA